MSAAHPPEVRAEKRRETYRRHNAKRAKDPAYIAKRREAGAAWHEKIKGTEGYRASKRASAARMRELYPEKAVARLETRRAIERGVLVRQPCEVCGVEKVEAHHDDYSRPLEVRWLCKRHHVEHHAKATGAS